MEVINNCKNPPRWLMTHIRRSMKWIYPGDFDGLQCIKLIDELSDVTVQSQEWFKEARKFNRAIGGWYQPKHKTPASITLHIKDIYRGIPASYYWTPVPTIILTSTLAHEVGHHLIAKRGYLFSSSEKFISRKDEEVAVEHYASYVIEKMREKWYHRIGHWAVKDLAEHHYILGILDWKDKKYEKAAEHWYNASLLNPEHEYAGYWYWRAKELCTPSIESSQT